MNDYKNKTSDIWLKENNYPIADKSFEKEN